MAKVKCRPERVGKPGRKTVPVKPHKRSTPKPIKPKCKQAIDPSAVLISSPRCSFKIALFPQPLCLFVSVLIVFCFRKLSRASWVYLTVLANETIDVGPYIIPSPLKEGHLGDSQWHHSSRMRLYVLGEHLWPTKFSRRVLLDPKN